MRAIAKLLVPLCVFAFACGGAPKPAAAPPPAPAPEPPPPEWQSSPESCGKIMGKIIELARSSGATEEELEHLHELSSNDKAIDDCVQLMTEPQYDCVMAATDYKALGDCESEEE